MAVVGTRQLRRNIKLVRRAVEKGANDELDRIAIDLRDRARALAPQLEGDLVESIQIAARKSKRVSARVVFSKSPYAVRRHESFYNLGPISSRKPSTKDGAVGRKYLERPYVRSRKANIERVRRRVARELTRALR